MENMSKAQVYISLAKRGAVSDIDTIMQDLSLEMTITDSKFIDFALGHVCTDEGTERLKYYLFHGTQIQRNYAMLYFGRKGEYLLIRKAYDMGLIDYRQAFSR